MRFDQGLYILLASGLLGQSLSLSIFSRALPSRITTRSGQQTRHITTRSGQQTRLSSFVFAAPSLGVKRDIDLPYFDEDTDDEANNELLTYLPDSGSTLPPQTKFLLSRATKSYIYGDTGLTSLDSNRVLLEQAIAEEYKSIDVPVQIGEVLFDVRKTGEDVDEAVAEVLSLAAMHSIPQEITCELLKLESDQAHKAFSESGWEGVAFPRGFALQLKRKFQPKQPKNWIRGRKRRFQEAKEAVTAARETQAPSQKLQTREEFLATMEEQFGGKTLDPTAESGGKVFFPNSTPQKGLSWRRIKRAADKSVATLKKKGKAGFLAYTYFNFILYSVGIVLQWPRVAPANPFSGASAVVVTLRKFARVYGSLYIFSNVLKIPKLFSAVALAPLAQRTLDLMTNRLKVSDKVATCMQVVLLFVAWAAIVSVPVLSEYGRIRRLINFGKVYDIAETIPAFYTVARMVVYQEC
jgi:hypothetical protein